MSVEYYDNQNGGGLFGRFFGHSENPQAAAAAYRENPQAAAAAAYRNAADNNTLMVDTVVDEFVKIVKDKATHPNKYLTKDNDRVSAVKSKEGFYKDLKKKMLKKFKNHISKSKGFLENLNKEELRVLHKKQLKKEIDANPPESYRVEVIERKLERVDSLVNSELIKMIIQQDFGSESEIQRKFEEQVRVHLNADADWQGDSPYGTYMGGRWWVRHMRANLDEGLNVIGSITSVMKATFEPAFNMVAADLESKIQNEKDQQRANFEPSTPTPTPTPTPASTPVEAAPVEAAEPASASTSTPADTPASTPVEAASPVEAAPPTPPSAAAPPTPPSAAAPPTPSAEEQTGSREKREEVKAKAAEAAANLRAKEKAKQDQAANALKRVSAKREEEPDDSNLPKEALKEQRMVEGEIQRQRRFSHEKLTARLEKKEKAAAAKAKAEAERLAEAPAAAAAAGGGKKQRKKSRKKQRRKSIRSSKRSNKRSMKKQKRKPLRSSKRSSKRSMKKQKRKSMRSMKRSRKRRNSRRKSR